MTFKADFAARQCFIGGHLRFNYQLLFKEKWAVYWMYGSWELIIMETYGIDQVGELAKRNYKRSHRRPNRKKAFDPYWL